MGAALLSDRRREYHFQLASAEECETWATNIVQALSRRAPRSASHPPHAVAPGRSPAAAVPASPAVAHIARARAPFPGPTTPPPPRAVQLAMCAGYEVPGYVVLPPEAWSEATGEEAEVEQSSD